MFIVIPVGREWTVTKQGRVQVEYHCEKCSLSTPVSLLAEGVGQDINVLFLNDEKAQRDASSEASKALSEDVQLSLRLMRCPGCGIRDGKAVAKVVAQGFWPAVGYSLLAYLIAAPVLLLGLPWLPEGLGSADHILVSGVAAIIIGTLVNTLRRRYQRRMARAREGVLFGDAAAMSSEEKRALEAILAADAIPNDEGTPQSGVMRSQARSVYDSVPEPEPIKEGEGIPCSHCGAPNLPSAEFCRQCLGTPNRP